jgi:MT0933-like antitoxin protein
MGIFDKAKDALGDNIEHVDAGIDKAADFVDDRTGKKYGQQFDQGSDFIKDRLDERDRQAPAASAAPAGQVQPETPSSGPAQAGLTEPAPPHGVPPAS